MKKYNIILVTIIVLLSMFLVNSISLYASNYPSKPITIMVPWQAGGTSDTLARAITQVAPKYMDQPFVVVNRAGASGTIATTEVAHAKPDGYTILLVASGPLSTQPNLLDLAYDPAKDLRGVINLTCIPPIIAVQSTSPYNSLDKLIEGAKEKRLKYSHCGTGSLQNLAMENLLLEAGISMINVPFPGGAAAVAALLGGHVDAVIANPSEIISGYMSGDLRLLGVMDENRIDDFPDVPTLTELGHPLVRGLLQCIIAPADTPDEIVTYLHNTIKKIIEDEDYVSIMKKVKLPVVYLSPERLEERYNNDRKAYGKIIEDLGLKK